MPKSHSALVQSFSAHPRNSYNIPANEAVRGSRGRKLQAAIESLEPRQLLSVSVNNGWTDVSTSGVKVIYASSSGSDSNNGLSPSSPVRTISKGKSLIGAGGQLLLARGSVFHEAVGYWTSSGSSSQPSVLGAYGSGARPVVSSGSQIGMFLNQGVHDVAVLGVKFDAAGRGGANPDGITSNGKVSNILVEDCEITGYHNNLTFQDFSGPINNVRIRRSVITDSYSSSAHSQGIFADGVHGLQLEECTFDHNGWGHGAGATMFNHNAYITAKTSGLVARGNTFANGSGFGLQARPGGDVRNNLFVNNAVAYSFGLVSGSGSITAGGVSGVVADNVVLGGHSIGGVPAGQGLSLGNIKAATVTGNVFAYQGAGNRTPAIGIEAVRGTTNAATGSGVQNLTIANNVIYKFSQALGISGLTPGANGVNGLRNLVVRDNDFQSITSFQAFVQGPGFNASAEHFSGNTYDVPTNQKTPIVVAGKAMTIPGWLSHDPGGKGVHINYKAPTLDSYDSGFLVKARTLSRQNWNSRYTASGAVSFIKAGFNSGATSGYVPAISGPTTSSPSPTPTSTSPSPTPTPTATSSSGSTTVSVFDTKSTEGNSGTKTFSFPVRLSGSSKQKITVKWETKGQTAHVDSDYIGQHGTLTFNPGETSKSVSIKVKGDKTREATETFVLNLLSASVKIADGQGVATVLNDD